MVTNIAAVAHDACCRNSKNGPYNEEKMLSIKKKDNDFCNHYLNLHNLKELTIWHNAW